MTGLIEAFSARRMPALPLILMLSIAYSVLAGGVGAGVASSAIAVAYAARYYLGGQPFGAPAPNLERFLILVLATPLVVATLGVLRRRLEDLLVRERDLRGHAEAGRQQLVNILESITDGFFAVDRAWRYTYVNGQAERLVGRGRQELLGQVVWEAFPPLVGSTWDHEYHRAVEQRMSVHFEELYPPLATWFETHAYPSEEGLTIYMRSINERKRAEETLRVRARQQAAVASLGQEALLGGDILGLMDQAVRTLAATLEVELAKILELLPGGDELVMRAGIGWKEGVEHRVDAGERSQAGYTLATQVPVIVEDLSTETRFAGPSLLVDHGVVSGVSVIISGRDRPFGILGAHTRRRRAFTEDDVHFLQAVANVLAEAIARKRGEDALVESEQRFRQLADNVHEVFYVVSLNPTRVLYVSPAYESVWGRSCASLYDQPGSWLQAVHPDDRARLTKAMVERDSGFFDGEYRVVLPDGSIRWIHDRSAPVLDRDRRPHRVVGIAEDVTEPRRAAEAAGRLAASEAAVRARDEVLATVAHELRNPLNVVSLAASTLAGPDVSVDRRIRQAHVIARAANRAERLIRDLLDVARIESGHLVVEAAALDISPLISEACESFQKLASDSGLTIDCQVAPDAPRVRGDRDRVLQVLGNLITNAIKFTPSGGRITIRATACAEGLHLVVEDTGPGIAPEALLHVFDRFWRASPADRRGLGLGLAIVKGIVDAHHGRVWAESERGKGSAFHVSLPRGEPPRA